MSEDDGSTVEDAAADETRPVPVVRVTVIGKPDCHLCAEARAVVAAVCEDLGVGWEDRSILDDPALFDQYWEQIPVTLVDGRQHDFWKVDPVRLRAALTAPPA